MEKGVNYAKDKKFFVRTDRMLKEDRESWTVEDLPKAMRLSMMRDVICLSSIDDILAYIYFCPQIEHRDIDYSEFFLMSTSVRFLAFSSLFSRFMYMMCFHQRNELFIGRLSEFICNYYIWREETFTIL